MNIDQIKKQILNQAQKDHVEVEVQIFESDTFFAQYQNQKLAKYSPKNNRSISIRVIQNGVAGFSQTENLSDESIVNCYKSALESAKVLSQQSQNIQSEVLSQPSRQMADFSFSFNKKITTFDNKTKLNWAQELESKTLSLDSRIKVVPYSGYSDVLQKKYYFNSNGVDLAHQNTYCSIYAMATAEQDGETKASMKHYIYRDQFDKYPGQLAQEIATGATQLLKAQQPTTGTYPIILTSEVVSQLIPLIFSHFSAKSLDEKTSVFADKLNQQIFSEKLTIIDDPQRPDMIGSIPFDDEGYSTQKVSLVEKGLLKNFLTNSFYSKKMGLPHTSHATNSAGVMTVSPHNIIIELGNSSFESMVNSFEEVIVINQLQGLHAGFKPSTGDLSAQTYGFLYRKGQKVFPIDQCLLAGNIFEMLKNIYAVGDSYHPDGGNCLAPSLMFEKLSIAGKNK